MGAVLPLHMGKRHYNGVLSETYIPNVLPQWFSRIPDVCFSYSSPTISFTRLSATGRGNVHYVADKTSFIHAW
jgi:hypothetical protein